MDQLQAVRAAARERFLAQCLTKVSAVTSVAGKTLAGTPNNVIQSLPPELLDAPISSLLADAPLASPPAKRQRVEPDAIRVPPEQTAEIRRLLARPSPEEVRIISWNIDGLDEVGGPEGTMRRTLAAALEVAHQRPVAVLLQEAVPPALQLLAAEQVLGSAYRIVVPQDPPMPYYVAILLDKKRVNQLGPPTTVAFPGTQMGRQLLVVAIELAGSRPLLLATAHLESTKDQGPERKRQLAKSLRYLKGAVGKALQVTPSGNRQAAAALLGGDLNLRDEEVKAVWRELGETSNGIADVWTFCGSPEDAKWTWDTVANNNVGVTYSCRSRFDRMFFISPGISDAAGGGVRKTTRKPHADRAAVALAQDCLARGSQLPGWRPTSFSLVGQKRVPVLGRFPSDHWGIMSEWSLGGINDAALNATTTESLAPPFKAGSTLAATGSLMSALAGQASERGTACGQQSSGITCAGMQPHPAAGVGVLPSLKPGRAVIDLDD